MDENKNVNTVNEEEEKVINFNALKKKLKWQKFKLTVEEKLKKGYEWCEQHPKEALAGGAMVLKFMDTCHKRHTRSKQMEMERQWREETVWDPSSGVHYTLRRKMKEKEKAEYERRWKAGEPRGAVLASMGLLKY